MVVELVNVQHIQKEELEYKQIGIEMGKLKLRGYNNFVFFFCLVFKILLIRRKFF